MLKFRVFACNDGEIRLLQAARDLAHFALADDPTVDIANRRDLRGGTGKKRLIRGIELIASNALSADFVAQAARDFYD